MNQFRRTQTTRFFLASAPVALLAFYEPAALLLAAPWLLVLLCVVTRGRPGERASAWESTADAARRRLAVR
jgi:hypothetical protein